MDKTPATFGERLRTVLTEAGLEQNAFAAKATLHPSVIGRHLDRTRAPAMSSVKKYSDAYGISIAWLVDGTGPRLTAQTSAPAAPGAQVPAPAVGLAALEQLLADYEWPSDIKVAALDEICSELRAGAETPAGQTRARSVWRVALEEALRSRARGSGSHRAPTTTIAPTQLRAKRSG